jgi:two-component system, NarL family, nitrate/nitrite response regulator NarL
MVMERAIVMEAVNPFGLTKRELDVLEGVLRAESNNRIASRLSIAPSTVKHHLANIFAKTGVVTRLQLAVFAMRHRLTLAGPAPERRAAA